MRSRWLVLGLVSCGNVTVDSDEHIEIKSFDVGESVPVPVEVPIQGIRGLSSDDGASPKSVCAVDDAGAIHCWGGNWDGDVAPEHADSVIDMLDPVQKEGGPWKSVIVYGRATCALKDDGSRWCWGSDEAGDFGDGDRDGWLDVPTLIEWH